VAISGALRPPALCCHCEEWSDVAISGAFRPPPARPRLPRQALRAFLAMTWWGGLSCQAGCGFFAVTGWGGLPRHSPFGRSSQWRGGGGLSCRVLRALVSLRGIIRHALKPHPVIARSEATWQSLERFGPRPPARDCRVTALRAVPRNYIVGWIVVSGGARLLRGDRVGWIATSRSFRPFLAMTWWGGLPCRPCGPARNEEATAPDNGFRSTSH